MDPGLRLVRLSILAKPSYLESQTAAFAVVAYVAVASVAAYKDSEPAVAWSAA